MMKNQMGVLGEAVHMFCLLFDGTLDLENYLDWGKTLNEVL